MAQKILALIFFLPVVGSHGSQIAIDALLSPTTFMAVTLNSMGIRTLGKTCSNSVVLMHTPEKLVQIL